MAVNFIGGGNMSTRKKNHRPAGSHLQTLSHNVVSSTPRLSGIRSNIEINLTDKQTEMTLLFHFLIF